MPKKYLPLFSIIIPPLILALSCKSTQVSQTPFYDDVSMYRLSFQDSAIEFKDPYSESNDKPITSSFAEPTGSATAEVEEKLRLLAQYANTKVTKMEGFRIQAYSGLSREDALKTKQQFTELYPDIKVEYVYRQPNHKIMVGNYLTKIQAHKFYTLIKEKFPTAIVVSELINFDKNDFIKN